MKKTMGGMVDFPSQGQSVRFAACLAAMLMKTDRAQRHSYDSLYDLCTFVSGFGLMQLDLSDDGQMSEDWNQSANVLLREFDWYIGFAFDYAGYDFEELTFFEDDKAEDWQAIADSIDRDMPVLALFGGKYSWVLVTGYDENGVLYGLDGHTIWGAPYEQPAGYDEEGRFVLPDWFERLEHGHRRSQHGEANAGSKLMQPRNPAEAGAEHRVVHGLRGGDHQGTPPRGSSIGIACIMPEAFPCSGDEKDLRTGGSVAGSPAIINNKRYGNPDDFRFQPCPFQGFVIH